MGESLYTITYFLELPMRDPTFPKVGSHKNTQAYHNHRSRVVDPSLSSAAHQFHFYLSIFFRTSSLSSLSLHLINFILFFIEKKKEYLSQYNSKSSHIYISSRTPQSQYKRMQIYSRSIKHHMTQTETLLTCFIN